MLQFIEEVESYIRQRNDNINLMPIRCLEEADDMIKDDLRMTAKTNSSPPSAQRRWKAECEEPSALAFQRFHHCIITNTVKKMVSSRSDTPATHSK